MEPTSDQLTQQQPGSPYPYPSPASSLAPEEPYGLNPSPGSGVPAPPVRANGLAIASLILGIVSLFLFGVIAGGLAIVYGGIALNQISKRAYTPTSRVMAIIGLALGVLGAALSLIFIVSTKR